MDATRAGKGAAHARGRSASWSRGYAAGRSRGRLDALLRAVHPVAEAGAGQGDPRAGLKIGVAVFKALAGGSRGRVEQAGAGISLATLWHREYEDERDARFINDRVHGNIQKDGTFSVVPKCPVASARRRS